MSSKAIGLYLILWPMLFLSKTWDGSFEGFEFVKVMLTSGFVFVGCWFYTSD